MPDPVTEFLMVHKDAIWSMSITAVMGAIGSYIAVLLQLIGGSNLSPREVWATLFIGTIFAMVFSSLIGVFIGVPVLASAPMGASALVTGMLGMRIAKLIMQLDVSLPNREQTP